MTESDQPAPGMVAGGVPPAPGAAPATAPAPVVPARATAASAPPVVGVRQLIGASFDLLMGAGEPVRRASFYIGLLVLLTAAPIALALWALVLGGTRVELLGPQTFAPVGGWFLLLLMLLFAGIVVATIESIGVAVALLGGEVSGAPISVRQAVQRSRMTFWSIVAASLIVSIPSGVVQQWIGQESQASVMLGLVLGIVMQAPFVYAQAGIVLGGVGPVEALRRSIRIVRARKLAALVLAILPTLYGLLVLVGFEAGVDLAVRSLGALGLGPDSGPAGVLVITVLIVMVVFAIGTLLFTATGIVYAPQVVMFVGLTRATMGLDLVRAGGVGDPDRAGPDNPRFRWLTRPLLIGIAVGVAGLAGVAVSALG